MSVNLKAKLNIMAGVAIAAVLLLAIISVYIEKKTTVGSKIYYNLKASNNFVADIAPPPMFMVYASRQVNNMLLSDAAQRKKLVREIEQGKTSMRMDKANQILALFGAELTVTEKTIMHG